MGQPGQADEFLKVPAINCGPLSVMIRGEIPEYLSRARCKTISTSSSADTIVWLATDAPQNLTGNFLCDRRPTP
jgi:hypothetical protein